MYRALPSSQRTRCVAIREDSIARVIDRSIVKPFRDVTDEQLHHSQKMELVGRLTAGVSHDLNNLLTVVSSNLDMIEHVAKSDKVGQFATAARRAIDLSAKLTSQLLSFSRRQKMNPMLTNVNQLISEFQGLMRQALGRGCDVKLRIDHQLWRCRVDPWLLKAALLNLMLNGRDAMPQGGSLELETRNVILHARCVDGRQTRSFVRVSVADTGCGIPAEVRERVFEPFFTTKEAGKGTGLGLSMVSEFVRQAGGHVGIDSTPGAGTTIALYLPQASEPEV